METLFNVMAIVFVCILLLMALVIVVFLGILLFEPTSKDLTKEEWKNGYRQK